MTAPALTKQTNTNAFNTPRAMLVMRFVLQARRVRGILCYSLNSTRIVTLMQGHRLCTDHELILSLVSHCWMGVMNLIQHMLWRLARKLFINIYVHYKKRELLNSETATRTESDFPFGLSSISEVCPTISCRDHVWSLTVLYGARVSHLVSINSYSIFIDLQVAVTVLNCACVGAFVKWSIWLESLHPARHQMLWYL